MTLCFSHICCKVLWDSSHAFNINGQPERPIRKTFLITLFILLCTRYNESLCSCATLQDPALHLCHSSKRYNSGHALRISTDHCIHSYMLVLLLLHHCIEEPAPGCKLHQTPVKSAYRRCNCGREVVIVAE